MRLICSCFILGCVFAAALTGAVAEEREVQLSGITLRVPEHWQQEEPANQLRLGQFKVPAVEGDETAAELSVFNFGGGGSVTQQIQRWKGQFATQGQQFQAHQGTARLGKYVLVELAGTYKQPVGPPILRQTKDAPGSRMLVVMVAVPDQGNYFLKLVGPDQTVAANAAAFRQAIGADASAEEPLEKEE